MWVWLVLLGLAAVLGAGGFLLYWVCGRRKIPDYWEEKQLLSHGHGARRGDVLAGKAALEKRRLYPVETESDDEKPLRGLLLPRKKDAKGAVILFHDRHGSWKLDCSGLAAFLHAQGYHVLLPDQRAHGRSGGLLGTMGLWERFDVRAWTGFAALRFGEDAPLWIGGVGMGGTAALMAAPLALEGNVRGIFSAGAYTQPRALLQWRAAQHTPLPAEPLLLPMEGFLYLFSGVSLREYSAVAALRETACPVLLFHGTGDRSVPVSMARELADAAGKKGTLVEIEGADHGCCRLTDPERVERALLDFLNNTAEDET